MMVNNRQPLRHQPHPSAVAPRLTDELLSTARTSVTDSETNGVTLTSDIRTCAGYYDPASSAESKTQCVASTACQPFQSLDQETTQFLRTKIRRLCRTAPFTLSDQDDLWQELSFVWYLNQFRYEPHKGSIRTFRKTILERASSQLLERARAAKRYSPTLRSLNDNITAEGAARPLDPAVDQRQTTSLSATQLSDLKLDLQEFIGTLPPQLAQLCERLKYDSPAELSKKLGIAHSTISSQVTAIRLRYQSQKLWKNLQKTSLV